jgi:hypothetical protein
VRVAQARIATDLALSGLPTKLKDDLVNLSQAGRADGLAVGQATAVGIYR